MRLSPPALCPCIWSRSMRCTALCVWIHLDFLCEAMLNSAQLVKSQASTGQQSWQPFSAARTTSHLHSVLTILIQSTAGFPELLQARTR